MNLPGVNVKLKMCRTKKRYGSGLLERTGRGKSIRDITEWTDAVEVCQISRRASAISS